ncbi:MAG: hypothetical protein LBE08_10780, partial [Bifidobacteriaceae bacterium]|nr:hypothetical protein [Bifidobacteriaceae bacterium]
MTAKGRSGAQLPPRHATLGQRGAGVNGRHRRWGGQRVLVVAGVVGLALALGLPAAQALWWDAVSVTPEIRYGVVGFAADRTDLQTAFTASCSGTSVPYSCEDSTSDRYGIADSVSEGATLSDRLTSADAVALAGGSPSVSSPNYLYIPYTVTSIAAGNSRLEYEATLSGASSGSGQPALTGVTARSTAALVLLEGTQTCAAGGFDPDLPGVTKATWNPATATATEVTIEGVPFPEATDRQTQNWCL